MSQVEKQTNAADRKIDRRMDDEQGDPGGGICMT